MKLIESIKLLLQPKIRENRSQRFRITKCILIAAFLLSLATTSVITIMMLVAPDSAKSSFRSVYSDAHQAVSEAQLSFVYKLTIGANLLSLMLTTVALFGVVRESFTIILLMAGVTSVIIFLLLFSRTFSLINISLSAIEFSLMVSFSLMIRAANEKR